MSLELDRWHVVERLVASSTIEPVDVVECGPFDVLDVASGTFAMDQLGLVETVEGFIEGVVMGIVPGANGRDDVRSTEAFGVADR